MINSMSTFKTEILTSFAEIVKYAIALQPILAERALAA